jgi:hypothetical protein
MSVHNNRERTKQTIAAVLDRIRTEVDPLLLEEYHRLFKKEVSLFHRSKVAAYLLMLCDQGKIPRPSPRDSNSRKTGNDRENESPRYPLAEEESMRLFFSVGRSRRVFPREILGLINTKTAIPREDIGSIRILDNYSFVQVRSTVAEKIIESLNGVSFRGRPLTVNYAKSRKDEENGDETNNSTALDHASSKDISNEDEDHSDKEDI